MVMERSRCTPACPPHSTVFCPDCGLADKAKLRRVRLMGPVGVANSNSPKIEEFFATGDPDVFARP
jgi:hypothetical protein